MRIGRTAGAMALIVVLGGGCATLQTARARIVKEAPRCPEQTVQIYFEPQSAEVTPEGRAVIKQAAGAAKGCVVKGVEVIGLADAAGAPDVNLELSKKRAQSVTSALEAAGLPAAEFKVAAVGQAGARTSEGKATLLRRRADVILHLAAPK